MLCGATDLESVRTGVIRHMPIYSLPSLGKPLCVA
jgi:hypothetical protein